MRLEQNKMRTSAKLTYGNLEMLLNGSEDKKKHTQNDEIFYTYRHGHGFLRSILGAVVIIAVHLVRRLTGTPGHAVHFGKQNPKH